MACCVEPVIAARARHRTRSDCGTRPAFWQPRILRSIRFFPLRACSCTTRKDSLSDFQQIYSARAQHASHARSMPCKTMSKLLRPFALERPPNLRVVHVRAAARAAGQWQGIWPISQPILRLPSYGTFPASFQIAGRDFVAPKLHQQFGPRQVALRKQHRRIRLHYAHFLNVRNTRSDHVAQQLTVVR